MAADLWLEVADDLVSCEKAPVVVTRGRRALRADSAARSVGCYPRSETGAARPVSQMVGPSGLEPLTSTVSRWRSNQLS